MYGQLPLISEIVGHEGVGAVVKGSILRAIITSSGSYVLPGSHRRKAGSDASSHLLSKRVGLG